MTIEYKFNEDKLLFELNQYINATYSGPYSKDRNFQAFEFIEDSGNGIGFTIGNVMKYAQRYGHKGTPEDFRKDLWKVVHYGLLALYCHDKRMEDLKND